MQFNFHRASLIFSLASATFVYGIAVGRYHVFPYGVIRDSKLAAIAWSQVLLSPAAPRTEGGPSAVELDASAGDEWILVTAGDGYVQPNTPQHGCVAWLLSREGTVRHVWRQPPDLWANLEQVEVVPGKTFAYPIGLHLFDDGGLLVNYQGRDCFPHGVGLAKLDRDSNVVWAKELLSHHWLTVAPDGKILVPGLRVVDSPFQFDQSEVQIVSDKTRVLEDTVLVLDPAGNVLEEISMLRALSESGYVGLFQGATDLQVNANSWDPLHLNDIRLAGRAFASTNPGVEEDDLLVSFRSLNTVGILDRATQRFKWISTGTTLRQHSPRFYDGGVLILDNLGGPRQSGGSRLVHVAFESGRPRVVFPVDSESLPGPFATRTAGHIDLHPDGRRALITVTHENRVWEVDLADGKVLWEYQYVHPIYTAKYCNEVGFPLNQEEVRP